ncbi:MAG: tetratricopeptide repeat protein [Chitinophagaceae bacterium]|nr:tetratricopeptide repeat protein [Chitinophagaceae bacterium]MCW5905360.1 tetratricopeptide repeat protein [Chitinophagaceae bacterium]
MEVSTVTPQGVSLGNANSFANEAAAAQSRLISYYIQGNEEMKLQDYYGAISSYNKAIQLYPNHSKAYYNNLRADFNELRKTSSILGKLTWRWTKMQILLLFMSGIFYLIHHLIEKAN